MTDILDILSFLRANRGRLNNVEVYGIITGYLDRPETLNSGVKIDPNCICVKVDLFAVKLDAYASILKANGIESPNNMYFINGSMACYVNKNYKMPDWYTFRGNLAIGSKQFSPFVTMFNFYKDNANSWRIAETPLSDVTYTDWGTRNRFIQYLDISNRSGKIIVPDEVKQFLCCKAEMPKPDILNSAKSMVSLSQSLDYNMNGVNIPNTKTFIVEDRDELREFSKQYNKLAELVTNADEYRIRYIRELVNKYPLVADKDTKDYSSCKYMLTMLRRYYKNKPTQLAHTGRAIVKTYLEKYSRLYNKSYLHTTAGNYVLTVFDEIVGYLLDEIPSINVNGTAWDLIKASFLDTQLMYAGILAVVVGIDVSLLQSVEKSCAKSDISFIDLINDNPYELLMFSSGLSISDIEKLAHALGIQLTENIKKTQNIGLLYNYTNYSDNGSTCYRIKDVYNSKIGITVTNKQYDMIMKTGSYLSSTVKADIRYYVSNSNSICSTYPSKGWKRDGTNWVLSLGNIEFKEALNNFIQSGLGVQFTVDGEDWITSMRLLEKELYVYNKVYELAHTNFNYNHEIIDKLIDKFEEKVGYKLEEKQRKAVHLCEFGVAVLTGPAGSGKTTTARCIVFVLQCYEEYKRIKYSNEMWDDTVKTDDEIISEINLDIVDEDNLTILYGCPTGKAAKRLQEVVGSDVKTMHSLFMVGSTDDDLFSEDTDCDVSDNPDIYIFDENAMVTIDLLYIVLKRIDNTRIWFLGDISQLPPIGKGLPFKNLLRFAPCVKLTVSKRSAEGSGITYNSQVINEYSESGNWRDLKSTDDFKIVPCQEDEIPLVTSLICKYYLNILQPSEEPVLLSKLGINSLDEMIKIPNLTEDDIQIVTPVGKSTYSWGTIRINNILQPLFNPKRKDTVEFVYQPSSTFNGIKYRVGDRVIHNKNNYGMQWYSSWKDGILQKMWGSGITNGDVGKIVGILASESCEFLEPVEPKPSNWKDADLRDDKNACNADTSFIVVKYFDFNQKCDYYILYQAKDLCDLSDDKGIKVFGGSDLSMIQLFYAGTCHKMQGSQGKLILTLLGSVRFKGFITRNMLYTMVTRASDGEYLIGSVSNNSNSQLSISRRELADNNVNTVGELLYK